MRRNRGSTEYLDSEADLIDLTEIYDVLRDAGATPTQSHFSQYWCGMCEGYYRSRVFNHPLEIELRVRERLGRLVGVGRHPRLIELRDKLNESINERVSGHALA